MKKQLLFLWMNLCCMGLFAQSGELTNLQFDTTVVQGQTGLTFTFDYTASEAGSIEWQLITAKADGSPDWGQPNFAYMVIAIDAATDPTTLSFTYDVPGDAAQGTYTWAGKVTLNGMDLGYNNTGNLVEVKEGTGGGPTATLSNLAYDATVEQGQTGLTFSFDYTASEDGSIEWQLITAKADGSPDWGQPNFAFMVMDVTAATDATTQSFTYDVPDTIAIGTYTWAGKVSLSGTDLGYNNTGNLVEVTLVSKVEEALEKNANLKAFPNPVSNALTIQSSESRAVFEVYNELGQLQQMNTEIATERSIDFSNLPKGIYWIKSNVGETLRVVKH